LTFLEPRLDRSRRRAAHAHATAAMSMDAADPKSAGWLSRLGAGLAKSFNEGLD
jgi:hypothetical protein